MLYCEDHRYKGEKVPATKISLTGNKPFCDACWVEAPWSVCSAGFVNAPNLTEEKPMSRELDEKEVRRLNGEGLNDKKIAEKLGCTYSQARGARIRLGLAPTRQYRPTKAARIPSGPKPRLRTGLDDGPPLPSRVAQAVESVTVTVPVALLEENP